MRSTFSPLLACLCALTLSFPISPAWPQALSEKARSGEDSKSSGCCEELKKLKVQVANLSFVLEEVGKMRDDNVLGQALTRLTALEGSVKLTEARLNDTEGKYSEMNSQLGLLQLQAAQAVTQTSTGKKRIPFLLMQKEQRQSSDRDPQEYIKYNWVVVVVVEKD